MFTVLKFIDDHKTGVLLFLGGIVGLIIGLIFAWGIMPVQWENAAPGHLNIEYQRYYVNQVARDYSADRNLKFAETRLGLEQKLNPWKKKPATLVAVMQEAYTKAANETQRAEVARLAQDLGVAIDLQAITPEPITEPAGKNRALFTVLGIFFIVLALVGTAFYIFTHMGTRKRKGEGPSFSGAYGVATAEEEELGTTYTVEEGPPLRTFVATYMLGDDFFDPSFSIEVDNDFLGECGVGISECLGAGDPKKVTALEAWLFDKSDIRTVTTVLSSNYAYNDPAMSGRLAAKGEITEIAPGSQLFLETTALRVQVRIKDVTYASGDLPENSFFQKVSFELRAWKKAD